MGEGSGKKIYTSDSGNMTPPKSDEAKNSEFYFFTSIDGENENEKLEQNKKKRISDNFFLSDLSSED